MTALAILAVAVCGGLGAAARYGCIQLVGEHWRPITIVIVNTVGSFIAGFAAVMINGLGADPVWGYAVVVGFCGGFTTFSTFANDAASLLRKKRRMRALTLTLATVLATVAFAAAGIASGEGMLTLLNP